MNLISLALFLGIYDITVDVDSRLSRMGQALVCFLFPVRKRDMGFITKHLSL